MSDTSSDDSSSDPGSNIEVGGSIDQAGPRQPPGKLVDRAEIASFKCIARLLSDDSDDEDKSEKDDASDHSDSSGEDGGDEDGVGPGIAAVAQKSAQPDEQEETLVEVKSVKTGRALASVSGPQNAGPSSQRQDTGPKSKPNPTTAGSAEVTQPLKTVPAGDGSKVSSGIDIFSHRAGIVSAALRKAWELDTAIDLFELQTMPVPRVGDSETSEMEIIAPSSTALAVAMKQLKPKLKRKKRVKEPAAQSAPDEPSKKKRKKTTKAPQASGSNVQNSAALSTS